MSEETKDEILRVDVSHLLDTEPEPVREKARMSVPVSIRDVTPDGEVIRDPLPTDKPVAVMPAEVIRGVSTEELMRRTKIMKEPCPDCQFFHFPAQGSPEYAEMVAFFSYYLSSLPDWMKASDAASRPAEWGICQGAPHSRRGPVHMLNSCSFFRKKLLS